MKNTLLLLLFCVVISCTPSGKTGENASDSTEVAQDTTGQQESENEYERFADISGYIVSAGTAVDTSELQVIDSTAAIIIFPTPGQIAEMEKEYGEDMATVADDAGFYQSNAMLGLDSVNIKTVVAKKRYLKFQGDDGKTWLVDIRQKGAPEWNIIFFNRKKTPRVVPAIDVNRREIELYFDVY